MNAISVDAMPKLRAQDVPPDFGCPPHALRCLPENGRTAHIHLPALQADDAPTKVAKRYRLVGIDAVV